MGRPRIELTQEQQDHAKFLYEKTSLSIAAIARHFRVSPPIILRHLFPKEHTMSTETQNDPDKLLGFIVDIPADLHPITRSALLSFVDAIALKARKAEEKYGYGSGWARADWKEECHQHMIQHMCKGDPRDVALYAMFCYFHNWATPPVVDATKVPEPTGHIVQWQIRQKGSTDEAEWVNVPFAIYDAVTGEHLERRALMVVGHG